MRLPLLNLRDRGGGPIIELTTPQSLSSYFRPASAADTDSAANTAATKTSPDRNPRGCATYLDDIGSAKVTSN